MKWSKASLATVTLTLGMAIISACEFESSITPVVWPTDKQDPNFVSPLAFTVSPDQSLIPVATTSMPATVEVAPTQAAPKAGTYAPGSRERAVQEAIDAGEYQRAIELAVDLYNIDISDASGTPQYNEDIDRGFHGATDPLSGAIEIGPKAMQSPSTLAATIGHESVHASQIAEGRLYMTIDEDGWPVIIDQQGLLLNQLEAFVWEREHAEEYGLSDKEIEFIEEFIASYYDSLTEENKVLADQGIYQLPEAETAQP